MSIASKIGCTGQTLNEWVKKVEVDAGKWAGVPTDMAAKLKALERESRELRRAVAHHLRLSAMCTLGVFRWIPVEDLSARKMMNIDSHSDDDDDERSVEVACPYCGARLYGYRKTGLWIVPTSCPSCDGDVGELDWDEIEDLRWNRYDDWACGDSL